MERIPWKKNHLNFFRTLCFFVEKNTVEKKSFKFFENTLFLCRKEYRWKESFEFFQNTLFLCRKEYRWKKSFEFFQNTLFVVGKDTVEKWIVFYFSWLFYLKVTRAGLELMAHSGACQSHLVGFSRAGQYFLYSNSIIIFNSVQFILVALSKEVGVVLGVCPLFSPHSSTPTQQPQTHLKICLSKLPHGTRIIKLSWHKYCRLPPWNPTTHEKTPYFDRQNIEKMKLRFDKRHGRRSGPRYFAPPFLPNRQTPILN